MAYPKERFSHWLYELPWFRNFQATTLPGYGICYRDAEANVPAWVRRHECEHVSQYRSMGWAPWAFVRFYSQYLAEFVFELFAQKFNGQAAYLAIPMEVAARAAQGSPWPANCPDHPVLPGNPFGP